MLPEGMQDIEIAPSFLLKGTNSPHGHPLAVLERSNITRVHSLKLFRKQCRTSQRLHFFSIRVTDQWNNLSDSRVTTTSLSGSEPARNEENWNHFKFIIRIRIRILLSNRGPTRGSHYSDS